MPTSRKPPRPAASDDGAAHGVDEPDVAAVQRRAPFSDNPEVGARGQRTRQRILDAAVAVFGDEGYHRASVDRITRQVGCSRATFYQYFSSKEDLFQQLAGHVGRLLRTSVEELGPVTAGAAGWSQIREWVDRHGDIYRRYEPVFQAFRTATESDESLAAGSLRWRERHSERFRSKVVDSTIPAPHLEGVVRLLFAALTRTVDMAAVLRSVDPRGLPVERIGTGLSDVAHRALFGPAPAVNVHAPGPAPATMPLGPVLRAALEERRTISQLGPVARQTLDSLTAAGQQALVRRGYHRLRVDDVVELAGVSHGAFYRYFDSKDHLARSLASEAMMTVSRVVREAPLALDGSGSDSALREWLHRYSKTTSDEAAMLQVWMDAALQDPAMRSDTAPTIDWGRRTLAEALRPRGFGDVDAEALVLLALLGDFGSRDAPDSLVEPAALIVERGLLGHVGGAAPGGDGPPAPGQARPATRE